MKNTTAKTNTLISTPRVIALATISAMSVSTLGLVGTANASVKGRRNTTLAAGAVTAYGLLKGKKKVAIAGAVGTAYAYSRYSKAKKSDKNINGRRIQWYKDRYGKNWRSHYKAGR